MFRATKGIRTIGMLLCYAVSLNAQVYSPRVLIRGQVDSTDLKSLAQGIYRNAHAVTDREKAEAIWRFYLTDGRFVKPGMFYHLPGWAYEEPLGEVLDPVKLLNSYGFGLCYQDAPLLEATWDAGGFKHTRVWFLTGHTVAEVFYGGQYHYYDSDMMGYTTIGDGPFKSSPVASVQQLEANRSILLSKLKGPKEVIPGAVDNPWYNADVRAGAIGSLANILSTADNNYVYGYKRYPRGHAMDFVLRPGERMIRYYNPPDSGIRYLPYKTDGRSWKEFPGAFLPVADGPKSEKDARRWSIGILEYRPAQLRTEEKGTASQSIIAMPSPYVIIGARFSMKVSLVGAQELVVETSTDGGHTWTQASTLHGPFSGEWVAEPAAMAQSAHGTMNAVAGTYGYLVRLTLRGSGPAIGQSIRDLMLATTFEFNPRTLPLIVPGKNVLNYEASDVVRTKLPIHANNAQLFAERFSNVSLVSEEGQSYLRNASGKVAEMVFKLVPTAQGKLSGFDTGGRFLSLREGLAPDKLTAEVRKVTPWPADPGAHQAASIAWSLKPDGPWITIWTYDPKIEWPDGHPVPRILRWPEVDRSVRRASGFRAAYIRYRFENLAVDDIRLATMQPAPAAPSTLHITHTWVQDGKPAEFTETISGERRKMYQFEVPSATTIQNQALILSAP